MNKKSLKKRKKVIKYIIFLLIIIVCGYAIKRRISPFQTDEEKQLKPVYKATKKGISGFKFENVWIEEDDNYVWFMFKLKNYTGSNVYTEKELETINKAVEQLVKYLNDNQDFENLYNKYRLRFQLDNTNIVLDCDIEYINNQATFTYLHSETSNMITDYYMMKDVYSIAMYRGFETVFEEENIEKLEALDNLEEIYFASGVDKERVKEFAILMKDINPDCKIFHDSEEVVITD